MMVVRGKGTGLSSFLHHPRMHSGASVAGSRRLSRSSVVSRSSWMAFAKKGVRVFLPRRGSEGTGLKTGWRSEIAVGVGCRGKEGCEEGERRMGGYLDF